MKKFLIIGVNCNIKYSNVFPMIQNNKLWIGYTSPKVFYTGTSQQKKFGNIFWFNNFKKIVQPFKATRKYVAGEYEFYNGFDVINVDRYKDIPVDYYGMMGVPITFYNKLNQDEYEIIDLVNDKCGYNTNIRTIINDRHLYDRLIIRRKV